MNREAFYFTYKPVRRRRRSSISSSCEAAAAATAATAATAVDDSAAAQRRHTPNSSSLLTSLTRSASMDMDYVTLYKSSVYRVRMRYSGPCSLSMYQSHWQP